MSREDFCNLRDELLKQFQDQHSEHMKEFTAASLKHMEALDNKAKKERKAYTQKIWAAVGACLVIIASAMGYAVDKSVEAGRIASEAKFTADGEFRLRTVEDMNINSQLESVKSDIIKLEQWMIDNSSFKSRGGTTEKAPLIKK